MLIRTQPQKATWYPVINHHHPDDPPDSDQQCPVSCRPLDLEVTVLENYDQADASESPADEDYGRP